MDIFTFIDKIESALKYIIRFKAIIKLITFSSQIARPLFADWCLPLGEVDASDFSCGTYL
jgi:hypothetical protein